MFGYLLISDKNQVLCYGGDGGFDSYLQSRLCAEGLFSPDAPSTSSGVYSDTSSTESLRDDLSSSTESRITEKATNPEISHLFLPLISMYRSFHIRCGDQIYTTTSDHGTILLKRLKYNFLLVSIGNSEWRQYQFMDYMELGLEVNLGPLLSLIGSDLSTVHLASDFLRSFSDKPCSFENKKMKGLLDLRRAIFFQSEVAIALPLLGTLASQLQNVLGPNRILLTSEGDILASVNSRDDEKLTLKHLASCDLNFLLQQISALESTDHGKIFQVWLRSKRSIIPYFVTVMVCSAIGGLTIICLSEARYGALIRAVATFLVQLDRVETTEDIVKAIQEMGKTVEAISRHFLAMAANNTTRRLTNGGFIKSPEQSSSFIRTIWRRTEALLQLSKVNTHSPEQSRAPALSLTSLRSAFSTLSLSSVQTQNSAVRREKLSTRCEVMISYVHRQATNMLQELCMESYGKSSEKKLDLFMRATYNAFNTSRKTLVSDSTTAWAAEQKATAFHDFLRPMSIGFDMVAFSVSIPSKSIAVSYTTDWIKKELDISVRPPTSCSCIRITGRSGAQYMLYRMRTEEKEPLSGINVLKKLRGSRSFNAFAVALFQEGIHNELAERQLRRLTTVITNRMCSVYPQIN
ncbi:hypothetical protein GCK32_000797 [Trichostrongylus colubriformis]|uniref:Uncharacterized protein n=1 Tax=Trichostrongylus colubriformis TaxID=6319 RepID=A0AAN8FQM5_TRICO